MADVFYVRVRGKISGPYDVATLQKQVRRGALSRIHEISSDRTVWSAAGQFEDLFPSVVVAIKSEPPSGAAPEKPPKPSEVPPSGGTSEVMYYFNQKGSTVGPVSLSVLKTLVRNATVRRDDLVWRENADAGSPAAQVHALAPLFNLSGPPQGKTPLGYYSPRTDLRNIAIPRRSVWPFLVVAIAMLVLSAIVAGRAFFGNNSDRPPEDFHFVIASTIGFLVLSIVAFVLWLAWLHRVHRDMKLVTENGYRISPGKAVGLSFVPVFDGFWIVYMPWKLASEINRQLRARDLAGVSAAGVMVCQIVSIPFAVIVPGVTTLMYAISMMVIQRALNRLSEAVQ